ASLTAKIIKGRTYYYARECRRVDGKPRIVRTVYLGSLERIMAAVQGAQQPPQPQSVDIAGFGDVAALYDLAQSIGLVELIEAPTPVTRRVSRTAAN
ncbi:MAG: transposase, partial [Tepidisphaeraceae bacterium]